MKETKQIPGRQPKDAATVLVVEDDPLVRALAVRYLTRIGCRVLEAEDAASALSCLTSGAKIDLLFTDVVLAGEARGTDLARQVRSRFPAIKVLFTSGSAAIAQADCRPELGDAELLVKPYGPGDLARAVGRCLGASG